MQLPVTYAVEGDAMVAMVRLPDGKIARASVPISPTVGAVGERLGWTDEDKLGCLTEIGAYELADEIGASLYPDEIGGRKKRKRRRKARRKKVFGAVKKVGKGVAKGLKKVAKNKLTKGLYKLATKIPVYGQLLEAGVKGVKGAVKGVKKVVKGVKSIKASKPAKIAKAVAAVPAASAALKLAAPKAFTPSRTFSSTRRGATRSFRSRLRSAKSASASGPLRVSKTTSRSEHRGVYKVKTPGGRDVEVTLR
jgi:hypothetical protein